LCELQIEKMGNVAACVVTDGEDGKYGCLCELHMEKMGNVGACVSYRWRRWEMHVGTRVSYRWRRWEMWVLVWVLIRITS
jgi:hypothetical protein